MLKTILVLIFGALLGFLPSTLAGAKAQFIYTDEAIPMLDEARAFRAVVDGIEIVGADVGPKNGRPVVLVGGFTTSFPYLRKFIRSLVAERFRVFVYNPPGQGRQQLYSGQNTATHWLGIDGMLKVFEAVRHFAHAETRGKRVVAIGHSLGGLQVRLGSMGVIFDEAGQARISPAALRRAQEETALLVPMFSMALFGEEVWSTAGQAKVFLLKDATPYLVNCVAKLTCLLPWPLNQISQTVATTYLRQSQNSIHRGLFGAQDLDVQELSQLGHFILPQNVATQIRRDMARWWAQKAFTTNSGLNLGEHWRQLQTSQNAIAALYVGGEHDSLLDLRPFVNEAQAVSRSQMVVVQTGHVGAFLSQALPQDLAQIIDGARDVIVYQGCDRWLKNQPASLAL